VIKKCDIGRLSNSVEVCYADLKSIERAITNCESIEAPYLQLDGWISKTI
jgi:hypothetical protein